MALNTARFDITVSASSTKAVKGVHNIELALEKLYKASRKIARGFNQPTNALKQMAAQGQEMNTVLNQMSQTLDKLSGSLSRAENQSKKTKKSFSGMNQVFRWTGLTIQRSLHDMGRFANKALRDTGKNIEQGLSFIGKRIGRVGAGAGTGNFLSPVLNSLKRGGGAVIAAVESIFKDAVKSAASIVGNLGKLTGSLIQAVTTTVGAGIGYVFGGPFLGAIIGGIGGSVAKAAADVASGFLEGFAGVLSGLASIVGGVFTAAVNVAVSILNGLLTAVQKIVEGIANAFASLVGKIGGIIGGIAGKVGVGLLGITGYAVKTIADMDKGLATAFGLIPRAGEKAFAQLRKGVLKTFGDVPFLGAKQLSVGLFEAISAGAREPGRAIEILDSAAVVGAITGLTDINDVVRALTRTSAIFNLEVKDTTDLLNQAQNLGQLTFQELARGIGLVAGISKVAGVNIKDLLEAVAAGSRVLDPESLFTGLRRSIQTLAAPTPEAASARERLGISFKELSKEEAASLKVIRDEILLRKAQLRIMIDLPNRTNQQRIAIRALRSNIAGLESAWKDANKASGKFVGIMESIRRIGARGFSVQQTREIVPEIKATAVIQGILSLGDAVTGITEEMENYKGVTEEARQIMERTFSAKISLVWKGFVLVVDDLWKAIEGKLIVVLDKLAEKMKEIKESDAFKVFKEDLSSALSAIGNGIVDAFNYLVNEWPSIEAKLKTGWETIQVVAEAAWEGIKAGVEYAKVAIGKLDPETSALAASLKSVKEAAQEAWNVIKSMAEGDMGPLTNAFSGLFKTISDAAIDFWDTFRSVAFDTIADISDGLGRMIQTIIEEMSPQFAKNLGISPSNKASVDIGIKQQQTVDQARGVLQGYDYKGFVARGGAGFAGKGVSPTSISAFVKALQRGKALPGEGVKDEALQNQKAAATRLLEVIEKFGLGSTKYQRSAGTDTFSRFGENDRAVNAWLDLKEAEAQQLRDSGNYLREFASGLRASASLIRDSAAIRKGGAPGKEAIPLGRMDQVRRKYPDLFPEGKRGIAGLPSALGRVGSGDPKVEDALKAANERQKAADEAADRAWREIGVGVKETAKATEDGAKATVGAIKELKEAILGKYDIRPAVPGDEDIMYNIMPMPDMMAQIADFEEALAKQKFVPPANSSRTSNAPVIKPEPVDLEGFMRAASPRPRTGNDPLYPTKKYSGRDVVDMPQTKHPVRDPKRPANPPTPGQGFGPTYIPPTKAETVQGGFAEAKPIADEAKEPMARLLDYLHKRAQDQIDAMTPPRPTKADTFQNGEFTSPALDGIDEKTAQVIKELGGIKTVLQIGLPGIAQTPLPTAPTLDDAVRLPSRNAPLRPLRRPGLDISRPHPTPEAFKFPKTKKEKEAFKAEQVAKREAVAKERRDKQNNQPFFKASDELMREVNRLIKQGVPISIKNGAYFRGDGQKVSRGGKRELGDRVQAPRFDDPIKRPLSERISEQSKRLTGKPSTLAELANQPPDRFPYDPGRGTTNLARVGSTKDREGRKAIEKAIKDGFDLVYKGSEVFKRTRDQVAIPFRKQEESLKQVGTVGQRRDEYTARREKADQEAAAAASKLTDEMVKEIEERQRFNAVLQQLGGNAEFVGAELERAAKAAGDSTKAAAAAEVVRGTGRKTGFAEAGDRRRLAFFEPSHADRAAGRSVRSGARAGATFGAVAQDSRRAFNLARANREAGLYNQKVVGPDGRTTTEVRGRTFGRYADKPGGATQGGISTKDYETLKRVQPAEAKKYVRERENTLERADFADIQKFAKDQGLKLPLAEVAKLVEENTKVDAKTGEETRTSLTEILTALLAANEARASDGRAMVDVLKQITAALNKQRAIDNANEQRKKLAGRLNGKGDASNPQGTHQ